MMADVAINPHAGAAAMVILTSLVLCACQTEGSDRRILGEPPGAVHKTVTGSNPDMNLMDSITSARSDLAQRINGVETDIKVMEARQVTWRDSSLGCPRPGLMYGQVLTSGVAIELWVNDKSYHYHAKTGGQPFYCENPQISKRLNHPQTE